MKDNQQKLDEYFNLARTSEPIFDIDDARHLVENSVSPVSKFNNTLGNLTMNAILLTTVAAVLWFATLGQQYQNNKNTSNTEISKIQDQNESNNSQIQYQTDNDIQKKIKNESTTKNNQNQIALISNSDDKNEEKRVPEKPQTIAVKGVNTIELTDSELENLGVTKENGKYYLLIGKKHPQKVEISKNSVLMNTLDNSQKENTNIWPKMITDMKGYKYLLAFESDNMQITHTVSKTHYARKIDTNSLYNSQVTFNDAFTWTDKESLSEDVEVSVFTMEDSLFKKNFLINNGISDIIVNDSAIGNIQINIGNAINIVKDSMQFDMDLEDSNKGILIYSTNLIDSTFNINAKPLDLRVETLNIEDEFDKYVINAKPLDIRVETLNIEDEFDKYVINAKPLDIRVETLNIEDEFDKYVRVNKLIPVKITLDDGAEMLLWYDSDVEFLNKLPEDMSKQIEPEYAAATDTDEFCEAPVTGGEKYFDIWRSCAGALEHLVIYPNPSSGPINAKFVLKEKRMVKATLHDLNGKLLSQLSTWETLDKGEHTIKLENKIQNAGMYLVVIQTNFNEQAVQRIIIE